MKIKVSGSNVYEILNESIHSSFEYTTLVKFAANMIDFLHVYFDKYVLMNCTYIGDWMNEQSMVNTLSRIYATYIQQNFNYFKNVESFDNLLTNFDFPTVNTLVIEKDTRNETMTIGEISPITAPTSFPDLNAKETGIDTPNTKNRGEHMAFAKDRHTDTNVSDYIKSIEKSRDLQSIVNILDILFRRLIEEYTKLY